MTADEAQKRILRAALKRTRESIDRAQKRILIEALRQMPKVTPKK